MVVYKSDSPDSFSQCERQIEYKDSEDTLRHSKSRHKQHVINLTEVQNSVTRHIIDKKTVK